jgi:preprotein translocase subunit SecG
MATVFLVLGITSVFLGIITAIFMQRPRGGTFGPTDAGPTVSVASFFNLFFTL